MTTEDDKPAFNMCKQGTNETDRICNNNIKSENNFKDYIHRNFGFTNSQRFKLGGLQFLK